MPLWRNRYDGPANDYVSGVAAGPSANIHVTGYSRGQSSSLDYLTLAFSSAGVPLWTNCYSSPGYATDQATALAVDDLGNVFVTGSASTNRDYTTIAYSAAGAPLWTSRYNGPSNGDDRATAVAVDAGGNVFVAGYLTRTGADGQRWLTKWLTEGVWEFDERSARNA